MTFSNPAGLWLLTLAVPLIALYFFKTRLKTYAVPFLPLWEESAAEQVKVGLRRLRELFSLLLLCGVLGGLSLALAGVEVPALAHRPVRYTIVIDDSASMAPRMDEAKAFVRDFIKRLYRKDEVTLVTPGGQKNLDALHVVRGVHFAPFLETLAEQKREGETWVVSDESEPMPIGSWRRHRVGRAIENVGIIHYQVTYPDDQWEPIVLVQFQNAGSKPATALGLTLEPGIAATLAVEGRDVRLPPDGFALDDRVIIDAPDGGPVPVIVFHEAKPNAFVVAALKTMEERGEVDAATSYMTTVDKFAETEFSNRTVMIVDGGRLERWPVGGLYLFFAPEGPDDAAAVAGPEVAWWDSESPVHRLIEFSGLRVKKARPLRVETGSTSILGTDRASLGLIHAEPGLRSVRLGFRLDDSNFPVLAAFPMCVRNAIRWLADDPPRPPHAENLCDPIETRCNAIGPAMDAPLPIAPRWWQDVPHPAVALFAAAFLLLTELVLVRR